MWSFFKNFIVIPLVLGSVVLTGWAHARNYLDETQRKSMPAQVMDTALDVALTQGDPVIRPFRKMLQPVIGRFFKQDYTGKIHTITASQFEALLRIARQKGYRAVLVYLYSTGCTSCSVNYDDINGIAAGADKDKLLTLAVAVDTTPEQLSDFLNVNGGIPSFKPFVLRKGDEVVIPSLAYFMDVGYTKPPFVALVDSNGRLSKAPSGLGRGAALQAKIKGMIGG